MDEVWQQQAVFRLLQLIELPLLENLLEGKAALQPSLPSRHGDQDLLYTSSYLDREVLKAFSEAQSVTCSSCCPTACCRSIIHL